MRFRSRLAWVLVAAGVLLGALGVRACARRAASAPRTGPRAPPALSADARASIALAADVFPARVRPGDALSYALDFRIDGGARIARDLTVFVHFEPAGAGCAAIAWQHDHAPRHPTSSWDAPGMRDGPRLVTVPESAPEGEYELHAGLYDPATLERFVDARPGRVVVARDALPSSAWTPRDARGEGAPAGAAQATSSGSVPATPRVPDAAELAGDGWRLGVAPRGAALRLEDLAGGAVWRTDERGAGGLRVRVERAGVRCELHAATFDAVEAEAERLVLRASLHGRADDGAHAVEPARVDVELVFAPTADRRGVRGSWTATASDGWSVVELTPFERAFSASERAGGALVLPRWLGQLLPADAGLPHERWYGENDLTMPMCGVLAGGCALLVAWEHGTARLGAHLDLDRSGGARAWSISLALPAGCGAFELRALGRGDHVAVARAYRERPETARYRRTWREKRDASTERLEGAALFRTTARIRLAPHTPYNPGAEPVEELGWTFDEIARCARHWREDLGVERANVLVAGWNRGGYDAGHPDVLPACLEAGGDAALARCSADVRAQGYLFTLHENFYDLYEDAPSWDPELVWRDPAGRFVPGATWFGGPSHPVCSRVQLDFARRDLPEIVARFAPGAFFLDTTLTPALMGCHHPRHAMTTEDDRAARLALHAYARERTGALGLEGGTEWAVPVADWFEGMLTHKTIHRDGWIVVPMFPLVFGDCVDLVPIQSDKLGVGDARKVLDLLLYGAMPSYEVPPHAYFEDARGGAGAARELPVRPGEAELATPGGAVHDTTFARADSGAAAGRLAIDRLIQNTWEVLSPVNRRALATGMTEHRFLRADRTVEETRFGDLRVVVNYGPEPFDAGDARLPRQGFLVESPTLLAFHAVRRAGLDAPGGQLFVVESRDGRPLAESGDVRVYHGFGPPELELAGRRFTVERTARFDPRR